MTAIDDERELAMELCDLADELTMRRFRSADLQVSTKPDRTPVTDADVAVEDGIREVLGRRRPADQVLGEERGGAEGPHGERRWILDPIDGTKNFSRGNPIWATLLALVSDGRPLVAAVSAPGLRRRWWASAGDGCYTREPSGTVRQCGVSKVEQLADAYLSTTDLGTWAEQSRRADYLRLSDRCWQSRAFGDFYQYGLLAEGVLDLVAEPAASPWDLAAVQLLVTEAGGRFGSLEGEPGFDRGSALASNGLLHEQALRVLGSG